MNRTSHVIKLLAVFRVAYLIRHLSEIIVSDAAFNFLK